MDGSLIAAVAGLIGVALGGGLQVIQQKIARRAEAKAVLSALVADVEALARLIGHRQFLQNLEGHAQHCRELIAAGHGDQEVPPIQMSMNHDYLALFNAVAPKIGLLDAYHADRIVRFYALLKAGTEALLTDEDWFVRMDARNRLEVLTSDLHIMVVAMDLAADIARFRKIRPPKGALWQGAPETPALPASEPAAGEAIERLAHPA